MSLINLANQELQKLMQESPETLLLDVRTPEEYEMLGHIPGTRLMPIHTIPNQIGTLNPEQATVVICEHGIRSADAGLYLLHNGFKKVYHLSAGMAEWNGPRVFAS